MSPLLHAQRARQSSRSTLLDIIDWHDNREILKLVEDSGHLNNGSGPKYWQPGRRASASGQQ